MHAVTFFTFIISGDALAAGFGKAAAKAEEMVIEQRGKRKER